jgi:hypothetical protein
LRRQLLRLLDDPQLRAAYAREAYSIVNRRYNPESAKEAYFSVFGVTSDTHFLQPELS